ncbi:hypothetical protein MED297_03597 [Reinekea sp. MED297]|uniref:Ribosomal RNA small subunit methyltransferase I n=2 Tax=Reinekea TaxID=230494 RepID=A4BFS4_9GAMM|nr:hypothetical protein MED297_03597 [Reinekea sp. MED297] [Reinekea blandensis MED297]
MADITERARQVLSSVSRVCCEDTRHSVRLLDHLGIQARLEALHEHNERDKSALILQWLEAGESIALISDAGTPLISDPGYVLVNDVVAKGLAVVPVPGASAIIAALSVAGLPTDRFSFEGFLPAKTSARQSAFQQISEYAGTVIFYESSHRIEDSLADLAKVLGAARQIVLARELTKTFETVLRGTVADVQAVLANDANQRRGEFVLLVQGVGKSKQAEISDEVRKLVVTLGDSLPPKVLAAALADAFGGRKKLYYDYLLSQRSSET